MIAVPFTSPLFHSVQDEDDATERALLARLGGAGRRVLTIASSGENALSLLTDPSVAEVHAVDINPAQVHLCELRRTAVSHLDRDDHLRLFGADGRFGGDGRDERLALYAEIRLFLDDGTRAYWDARSEDEIAFGLHHVGRQDALMRDIVSRLRYEGFAPLEQPLAEHDLSRWCNAYLKVMTPGYIRLLFSMESETLAARIAGIAGYIAECHFRALRRPDAASNPYLTAIFGGSYAAAAGDAGYPRYLQRDVYEALSESNLRARLFLHTGSVSTALPQLAAKFGPFDLISVSNVPDWMSDVQFTALTMDASDSLAPGGALLARSGTPSRMIQSVVRHFLNGDDILNAELAEIERGPTYRVIAAGLS